MIKFNRSVSQVRVVYILTTIFLVGLSMFTFTKVRHLFEFTGLMNRSHEVKASTHVIKECLLRAEYLKRGFLLSGDSLMLHQRDQAIESLHREQEEMKQLLQDNPEQLRQLSGLTAAIEKKLKNIDRLHLDLLVVPVDSTINMFVHSQAQLMDSIQQHIESINRVETQMFNQRSLLFSKLSVMTPIYIIILFLGAVLILFFSYFSLTRQLEDSQRLHAALVIQNKDRGALAKELLIVNQELAYQNEEKEKRSGELMTANEKLAYENKEKEMRAADLVLANKELAVQYVEKERLAAQLALANRELAMQNEEKERRATELYNTNKELELFLNISSHDLQEPLRKIQMAASRIDQKDTDALSEKGREHFFKMQEAARRMHLLIKDLLTYSKTNSEVRKFEDIDLRLIIEEVKMDLMYAIEEKGAHIEVTGDCKANIIPFQFKQLLCNIISNGLKFSIPGTPPVIRITNSMKHGHEADVQGLKADMEYCHISISDNGIGFEPEYKAKIFEVFQRLHGKEDYEGTGIGLSIVKKIVDNHNGVIVASGQLQKGATFDIYIPTIKSEPHG